MTEEIAPEEITIGGMYYVKCTLYKPGPDDNIVQNPSLDRNVLQENSKINNALLETKSPYAGIINSDHTQATAYIPEYRFDSESIVDEHQYQILRDILVGISDLTQTILPEKIFFNFNISNDTNPVETAYPMYVGGKYRLPDQLVSLFSLGQELLHRVSLTQYGLTQNDRKWIKSQDLKKYVMLHKNDKVFLRLWSILMTASLRSTDVFQMDPSKWVDPKILAIQKITSERTAAEINEHMLENK